MGSADQPGQPAPPQQKSDFARGFERAVGRARVYGLTEKFWERAAPTVGGIAGVFLTASWLGMWQVMPPSLRVAGVALFAAALAYAVKPLFKLRLPDRDVALRRMDRVNGPDRPATTYDELPAGSGEVSGAKTIWRLERDRIEEKVGGFRAGLPRSNLGKRDPFALRLALALATGLSFFVAHDQNAVTQRLAAAFDWQVPPPVLPPLAVDAWVTPPDYTRVPPVVISSKDAPGVAVAGDYTVPQGSTMTILYTDRRAAVAVDGGLTPVQEACRPARNGDGIQCSFTLSASGSVSVRRLEDTNINWRFDVTPDRPPSIRVVPGDAPPAAPAGTGQGRGLPPPPRLSIEVDDEYGATVPEVHIIRPDGGADRPADPDADPLPLYDGRRIVIPGPDAPKGP